MKTLTKKQACEADSTVASLYFWNDHALFAGFTPDNVMHKHHAVEIFIGMNKPMNLVSEGRVFHHRTMILNANVPHHVSGHDDPKIVFVFDSEATVARKLVEKYLGGKKIVDMDSRLAPVLQDIVLPVGGNSSCQNAESLYETIINSLLDSKELKKNIDQRVQAALDCIRELELKKISAKLIAETICLSESRLTHLFKEQVGIPIRRYLLWMRLIEAVKSILDGYSLTDAAHNAGFADYAHLSRTFKKMFGNPLSLIFKNSRFVHVFSCFS